MPVDHSNETTKNNFVRSRSLRLPSQKSNELKLNSPFQRNGKLPSASPQTSASKPVSLFRRPLLRNSDRSVSKSPAHRALSVDDPKRNHLRASTRSAREQQAVEELSDSPTSTRSDKSHSSHGCPWSNTSSNDLVYHLKRLTEEHEKLQVEYARLRLQLVEQSRLSYMAPLSQSDSQLTSIPEKDSPDSPDVVSCAEDRTTMLERLACGYRAELTRTEEQLRLMQRKYWELVISKEETTGLEEAGHQVVDLLDRLQRKQEALDARVEQISQLEEQLQECHDRLEEAGWKRDGLQRRLQHAEADLAEARESADFLSAERATMAEALQEAEQLRSQQAGSEVVEALRRLLTSAGDFSANHLGLQEKVREVVESEVEETEEALWLVSRLERVMALSQQKCLSEHCRPLLQPQDQPSHQGGGQSWEWPDTELRHKRPQQGEDPAHCALAAILQAMEELPEEERNQPTVQHLYHLAQMGTTSEPQNWI